MLNALLDAEADRLCGVRKCERSEGRKDTRAGSYDRHLNTKAGEVTLTVPKPRSLSWTQVPAGAEGTWVKRGAVVRQAAGEESRQVAAELREIRLARAAAMVEAGVDETLSYYAVAADTGGVCAPTTAWND